MARGRKQKFFLIFVIPSYVVLTCCYIIYYRTNDVAFVFWGHVRDRSGSKIDQHPLRYRLSDMVTSQHRWWVGGEQFHLTWFPESIASEYMRLTKRQENLGLLNDIINERATRWFGTGRDKLLNATQSGTLAVHLRLGDVMADRTMEALFDDQRNRTAGRTGNYVIPLSFYNQYALPRGVSHVILFGNQCHGIRAGASTASSLAYHDHVRSVFQGKLATTHVVSRLPENCSVNQDRNSYARMVARRADEDFVLMLTMAGRLLVSGGGYSRLLKRLATSRGITVDDPLQDYSRWADNTSAIAAYVQSGVSQFAQKFR